MFKNRVRTAALAGAIAVATGVSGLTVPAYAEDGTTHQTDNGQHVADGSKAGNGDNLQNIAPVGQVKAADALKKAANDDKAAIDAHKTADYSQYQDQPIEAEAQAKAEAHEAEATKLLTNAVATLNDINATLKDVEAQTAAAEAAWAKYADAVTISDSEKATLVELAKNPATPEPVRTAVNDVWTLTAKPGDDDYYEQVTLVAPKVIELAEVLDNAIKENYGKTDKELVDELNATTAISNQLNTYLTGFDNRNALYKEAIRLTNEATNRNIVDIKEAYAVAQSNVRKARTIQAYYGLVVRWLDLYENDTILGNEQSTLREEYRKVLFDNANPKGEARSLEFYAKSDRDGLAWENPVQRVRLLDKKYRNDAPTIAGADNTAEKERGSDIDRLIEAINGMQDAKDTKEPGDTTKPGDKTKTPSNKGDLSGATIAAIVIGVLAALGGIVAVAFPHIQQFLPKF
ncbi:hypothetical protein CGLAU_10690 [Corynebacterium glaucum]|uniref:Uncharacterized protein n=1 Tax=Corynebacterium glaucum TaxID=187491 RepID=A0A1Q2HYZ8_9CORY|nr:hypothetical protein [Corynebacterium glaucum]AQQ16072.1 hypothetical protein CGLAU_10690 [Corynebacterium glaucum]